MNRIFTIAELAAFTGHSVQVVNSWVRNQGLPTIEGVTPRSVDLTAYETWVANRKRGISAPRPQAAALVEITETPSVRGLEGRCFQTRRGGNLYRVEETVDNEVVKLRAVDSASRRSVDAKVFWREYVEVADPAVGPSDAPRPQSEWLDLTPYRTEGYLKWLGVK